jgi:hypothetical protein
MPVRRGHVAPQNTYLDTIIRKFEGQSECACWGGRDHLESGFGGRRGQTLVLTSDGARAGGTQILDVFLLCAILSSGKPGAECSCWPFPQPRPALLVTAPLPPPDHFPP